MEQIRKSKENQNATKIMEKHPKQARKIKEQTRKTHENEIKKCKQEKQGRARGNKSNEQIKKKRKKNN